MGRRRNATHWPPIGLLRGITRPRGDPKDPSCDQPLRIMRDPALNGARHNARSAEHRSPKGDQRRQICDHQRINRRLVCDSTQIQPNYPAHQVVQPIMQAHYSTLSHEIQAHNKFSAALRIAPPKFYLSTNGAIKINLLLQFIKNSHQIVAYSTQNQFSHTSISKLQKYQIFKHQQQIS